MSEMNSLTLNGNKYDSFVDAVARPLSEAAVVICSASGESLDVTDSTDYALLGLSIYGKSTQDGTPTPDTPVDIVSVENPTITINGRSLSVPHSIRGIPGVCDEVDLARGVRVQRVCRHVFTGEEDFAKSGQPGNYYLWKDKLARPNGGNSQMTGSLCNRLVERVPDRLWDTIGDGFAISTVSPYCVHLRIETLSTVDALKAQLASWYNSGNPLVMVFELATPVETPLSAEEIATYGSLRSSKYGMTITNNAGAGMSVEYVADTKKYIDRIVGSASGASARLTTVTLAASKWAGSDSLYSQVVTIDGITEHSKVDLLPSVEQLAIFHNKDVAFVTENEDGVVTVFAIGDKPTQDYTMQAQITEVAV